MSDLQLPGDLHVVVVDEDVGNEVLSLSRGRRQSFCDARLHDDLQQSVRTSGPVPHLETERGHESGPAVRTSSRVHESGPTVGTNSRDQQSGPSGLPVDAEILQFTGGVLVMGVTQQRQT